MTDGDARRFSERPLCHFPAGLSVDCDSHLPMKPRGFPTRTAFFAWLAAEVAAGHHYSGEYPLSANCPLAVYLRTHGLPHARVHTERWGTGRVDESLPLPAWACEVVWTFDSSIGRRSAR
jgi:hypothetical protein